MKHIAIIEDSKEVNNALAGFCKSLGEDIEIDQFYDRQSGEDAIKQKKYNLIVLDIELPPEKNAGIGITVTNIQHHKSPVMVVSGLEPSFYRGIMKQLDIWDYMEKPIPPDGQDFIDTALRILRSKDHNSESEQKDLLSLDSATGKLTFKGKQLNLPQTAKYILLRIYERRKSAYVPYEDLYDLVKSGRNSEAVRQHVKIIRDALSDINESIDHIAVIRMKGVQWLDLASQ